MHIFVFCALGILHSLKIYFLYINIVDGECESSFFFKEGAHCQTKTTSHWVHGCSQNDQKGATLVVQANKMLATVSVSGKCSLVTSSKAHLFSECKIPRAWTTDIHLLSMPHMYLSPQKL